MPNLNKWQKDFMIHLFCLLTAYRGRNNFENLSRQGHYNESTYRNNYDKTFDFLKFNQYLVEESCEKEIAIAFDPSFISKSGKHTVGLNYFWSGCANRAKMGLEIAGFGAVDILNNTCMHLSCKQTVNHKKYNSLVSYYADLVISMADELQKTSKYLLVDAYFSKSTFVNPVAERGFTVISRLRNDAVLFYKYLGVPRKGRGRPKKYEGKVNVRQLSEQHFSLIIVEEKWKAYEAVVYSKSLKRWIKVVVVHYFDNKESLKKVKIYFSTDFVMSGSDVLIYYKSRFQIEFLYRDAKQFVGLEQCQSRKEKRLDFHFNAALTTVSIAKALHHLSVPAEQRKPFSMFSIKAQYFNELLMDRFFSLFGISPKPKKNNPDYLTLRDFGKIAA